MLPTERIAFQKQLALLRAFEAGSGLNRRAVSLKEVGEIVGMKPETVSTAMAFFIESGLVHRTDKGFVPSDGVHDYKLAHEWDPSTAATKLAPALRQSWAFQELQPRLRFSSLDENKAIETLATESHAGTFYRPQLEMLLDYLEAAGLIRRDQLGVHIQRQDDDSQSAASASTTSEASASASTPTDHHREDRRQDHRGYSGGGSDGPTTIHPAIVGLLRELPPPGGSWPKAGKERFKIAFATILDVIYPTDDEE